MLSVVISGSENELDIIDLAEGDPGGGMSCEGGHSGLSLSVELLSVGSIPGKDTRMIK